VFFRTLREKEGLVYASGVISVPEVDPGYIVFYAATSENNIPRTKEIILDVIKDIDESAFTDGDIEASRNMLISQQAYSLETNHSLSMVCTLDELYGLGYDQYKSYPEKINSVTRKDIGKAIKNIFERYFAEVIVHSR
jgi:predicted Zn-dependent peptidase